MFSNMLPFGEKRREAMLREQIKVFVQLSCLQKQNCNPSQADADAAMFKNKTEAKISATCIEWVFAFSIHIFKRRIAKFERKGGVCSKAGSTRLPG